MDMKAQGMYVCRTLSFEGEQPSQIAASFTIISFMIYRLGHMEVHMAVLAWKQGHPTWLQQPLHEAACDNSLPGCHASHRPQCTLNGTATLEQGSRLAVPAAVFLSTGSCPAPGLCRCGV